MQEEFAKSPLSTSQLFLLLARILKQSIGRIRYHRMDRFRMACRKPVEAVCLIQFGPMDLLDRLAYRGWRIQRLDALQAVAATFGPLK